MGVPRAYSYQNPWPVGVMWILFVGVFAWIAGIQAYEDHQFSTHGAPVTGTVDHKYTYVTHDKHGPTTHYCFVLRYEVGDLAGSVNRQVLHATFDHYRAGDAIPLKYLPENPRKVRVDLPAEIHAARMQTDVVLGVAAFFFLIGLVFFAARFRANAICRRLLSEGLPAQGVVTDIPLYRGQRRVSLQFKFRDSVGNEIVGRSGILGNKEAMRWSVGDPVSLRYDRNNPRRFTLDPQRSSIR